jgi:hypothetical protein
MSSDNDGLNNPNNPVGPYIVDGTGGSDGEFEPGIDDLERSLRTRLGDYLSTNTVHGHTNGYSPTHGNAYTVRPGSEDYTFSNADGRPVDIITAGGRTNTQNVFSPIAGRLDTEFNDSELFENGTGHGRTLGELLSKSGNNAAAEFTGHTLLRDGVIHGNLGESGEPVAPSGENLEGAPVSQLVSQALLKNRWNPRQDQTPFDADGDRVRDNTRPIAGFQKKLGSFDPNGDPITFEQLRNVGLSLMLRATGDDVIATTPINPRNTETLARLGPGANQLGIPRSYPQIDPNNAYGAPGALGGAAHDSARPKVMAGKGVSNIRETSAGLIEDGDGIAPFSFGSYNNFIDNFGKNSAATQALAGTLALTLGIAVKPLQLLLMALMEPVTAIEALARVQPIGSMKIGANVLTVAPPFIININDIIARIDAAGKSPLIFTGRSSRRSLLLSPIPLEQLGIVIPDNQSGLAGLARATNVGPDSPMNAVGDKFNLYTRTVEWGLLVMFFPGTVVQSPGYYITVAREIIRASLNLSADIAGQDTEQAKKLGRESGAPLEAGVDLLVRMLQSKMINFLNVMTTIGNASLKQNPMLLQVPLPEAINRGMPILGVSGQTNYPLPLDLPTSYQDMVPSKYAMSDKVGNFGAGGRGPGYRVGNALSMLILPASFMDADADFKELQEASSEARVTQNDYVINQAHAVGGKLAALATKAAILLNPGFYLKSAGDAYGQLRNREAPGPIAIKFDGARGNFRYEQTIDTATREAVEAELDAEYMPFYFHDLRTNEIVGLQAFLENLTDNYSVSHASTSAYGRVDDIMVYQKTKRAISVGFTIACTNHVDFEVMYTKINKLVTMIYPQWSAGRTAIGEDTSITIPFSQIPTASPVIRLRIGDIIRTNGSRFNLLRLFGMGNADFKIGLNATQLATAELYKKANQESIDLVGMTLQELAALAGIDVPTALDENLAKFISNDHNPVLRSFNAVSGQGLAGVITSMNFNWMGGGTWEVARYSSRAPKLCKVTISFSPIHDIAPGIDADGMNRAPLYPVGATMSAIAGQSAGQSPEDKGRKNFEEFKKKIDQILNKMIDKTGIVDYT